MINYTIINYLITISNYCKNIKNLTMIWGGNECTDCLSLFFLHLCCGSLLCVFLTMLMVMVTPFNISHKFKAMVLGMPFFLLQWEHLRFDLSTSRLLIVDWSCLFLGGLCFAITANVSELLGCPFKVVHCIAFLPNKYIVFFQD